MTELQGWFIIIELACIFVLMGMIGKKLDEG
jgi:hypothetical protein